MPLSAGAGSLNFSGGFGQQPVFFRYLEPSVAIRGELGRSGVFLRFFGFSKELLLAIFSSHDTHLHGPAAPCNA
jgi:hypothetical protein